MEQFRATKGTLNTLNFKIEFSQRRGGGGRSGGAMVLGKLPVPGRPTILITVGHRPNCACSRCGWGWFGHFYSHLSFLHFLPLFGRRLDID